MDNIYKIRYGLLQLKCSSYYFNTLEYIIFNVVASLKTRSIINVKPKSIFMTMSPNIHSIILRFSL